jgi:hypothetical protein
LRRKVEECLAPAQHGAAVLRHDLEVDDLRARRLQLLQHLALGVPAQVEFESKV